MKKFGVLLFGISLLGISYYGLSNDSYFIHLLMNLDEPYMYARLGLVTALLAYAFIPQLRLDTTKSMLGGGGVMLLLLGVLSLYSPTMFGNAYSYVLIGDMLTLIEGGILAIVLSAELPARKTTFIARGLIYVQLTLANLPTKLAHPLSQQPKSLLKAQLLVARFGMRTTDLILRSLRSDVPLNNKAPPS